VDQLDIFANSRDVALLNDALIALQRYDDAGTRRVMQVLAAEFPCDHHLPVLELLVNAIGDDAGTAPICSYVAAMETATLLTVHVRAAAIQLLGHRDAKAWLPVLWRRLAHRCAMLAYSPRYADCHSAAFLLEAGDWDAARRKVSATASWRRLPAPLAWMTEATWHIEGMEAAWPMLAELAWLSPSRFDTLAGRLADSSLDALLLAFNANFEANGDGSDLAWFPVWALIEKTGLARWLAHAQPSRQLAPERAMRLVLDLLILERDGRQRELLARRRELQELSPAVYRAYMRTR
jgi:hypothetical protein